MPFGSGKEKAAEDMGEKEPKKGLAVLLAGPKKEDDAEGGDDEMASAVASDLLSALKSENEEQLTSVIKNLVSYLKD